MTWSLGWRCLVDPHHFFILFGKKGYCYFHHKIDPNLFLSTVKLLFSCIPPAGRSISFIKRVTFYDLHLFISHLLVQPTNHQTYQYMCYLDSDKIWHSLLLYPFQRSHLFLQSFYLYPSYSVKDEGIPLASLRERKRKRAKPMQYLLWTQHYTDAPFSSNGCFYALQRCKVGSYWYVRAQRMTHQQLLRAASLFWWNLDLFAVLWVRKTQLSLPPTVPTKNIQSVALEMNL